MVHLWCEWVHHNNKTYEECFDNEITSQIKTFAASVKRVDLVFDIHQKSFCKSQAREVRGKSL